MEGIGWFGSVIGRLSSVLRLPLVIIAIVFHRRCTKFWHPSDPAATLECPSSCSCGNINHPQRAACAWMIELVSFVPLNLHIKE